jgi:endonuclease/exonuclease/phosphatase family metal-dependent hydrolase
MFAGPLTIFTLNLNIDRPHPDGDRLVRDEIHRLRPDLISFQEALWNDKSQDQARQILDELSYETVHQFELQSPDRPYGTAIASRFPIVRSDLIKLPSTSRGQDFPRALQTAEIEVPEPVGRVLLLNPKPHYEPHMELEREMQAVAVVDYVDRNADPNGFPPLIAGDLDATPPASSMRFLTGLKSLHGRSTCFIDAWVASGNTDPGYTWSCDNDFTRGLADQLFGFEEVRRRIDYILIGSPLLYKGFARIQKCEIVLNQPKGTMWASGHFGLYAEIRITPND